MNRLVPPLAESAGEDAFRAGWVAGFASRQGEVDQLEDQADRLYRVAFDDTRRLPGHHFTRAELEQRRRISEPPPEVTRRQALASWGLPDNDVPPARAAGGEPPPGPAAPTTAIAGAGPNRPSRSRSRTMTTRTIIGNLAAEPERVQAGRVQIVKLRLIEHTGEYRQGVWAAHEAATTHVVEAKFELAENVLATLHTGDAVIVVGYERTVSWGADGQKRYGRVIDADAIGPNLTRATATLVRTPRAPAAP